MIKKQICWLVGIGFLLLVCGQVTPAPRRDSVWVKKHIQEPLKWKPRKKREAHVELLKDVDTEAVREFLQVIIAADGPVQRYRWAFVPDPLRMVVDIPGKWKNTGEPVLNVSDNLITRIRVGEHPGKLRIVMDLKGNRSPAPVIEELPKGLGLVLNERHVYPLRKGKADKTVPPELGKQILKGIVTRERPPGEFCLFVSANARVWKYRSFFLRDESPHKFVLDLGGKWKNPGKSVYPIESKMVKAVRVGEHPDYLRVVMDLKTTAPLSHMIEGMPKGLMVTVKRKVVMEKG